MKRSLAVVATCLIAGSAWVERAPLPVLAAHVGARAGSSRGETTQPLVARKTVGGLAMSISLPRIVYPRNALVRVTLRVRNASPYTITLLGPPISCRACSLDVWHVDANGNLLPTPARFQEEGVVPTGPPSELTIPPGGTITRRMLVILWSARLRLIVNVFSLQGNIGSQSGEAGPTVTVRLVHSTAPRVDLLVSNGVLVQAVVHPTDGVTGPILFHESVFCSSGQPGITGVVSERPELGMLLDRWGRQSTTVFQPLPCPTDFGPVTLQRWELLAGWLNRPVATVDYTRP